MTPPAASAVLALPARRHRPGPTVGRVVVLLAAVLAVHLALLHGLVPGVGERGLHEGVRRLDVRVIDRPAATMAEVPAEAPADASPTPARPTPPTSPATPPAAPPVPIAPPRPPGAATADVPPQVADASSSGRAPEAAPAPPPVATAPTSTLGPPSDASAPGAAAVGGDELPVYATQPPAPARLLYGLRRGGLAAPAVLLWQHDGQRYELTLESSLTGQTILEQASQGGFDRAGLAPLRFADRRRGRDLRAANFQREAGKITFSGPTVTYSLLPGMQDRLSLLVQLGAIAAAAPEAMTPGRRLVLFVVGSRGEGDLWTFTVLEREEIDGRPTVRLLREPLREYDTRLELWLDPALGWWPRRLRQGVAGVATEPTELTLEQGPTPP